MPPILLSGHPLGGGKGAEEVEEGASEQQGGLESLSGRTKLERSISRSQHAVTVSLSEFYHLIYANIYLFYAFPHYRRLFYFAQDDTFHILKTKQFGLDNRLRKSSHCFIAGGNCSDQFALYYSVCFR